MKQLLIAIASLALVAGCSGNTPLSKTVAPSPLPGTAPLTTSYVVKGVVFTDTVTGILPLEGAQVQGPRGAPVTTGTSEWSEHRQCRCRVLCSNSQTAAVFTDASGRYLFPELFGRGDTLLLVRKDGYTVKNAIAVGNLEGATVTVNADTQFDIELIRR